MTLCARQRANKRFAPASADVGLGGILIEESAVGIECPDSTGYLIEDVSVGGVFKACFGCAADHEDAGLAIERISRLRLHIGAEIGLVAEFASGGGALGKRLPALCFKIRNVVEVLELVKFDLGTQGLELGDQRHGLSSPDVFVMGENGIYNALELVAESGRLADACAMADQPILAALEFFEESGSLLHFIGGGRGEHAAADGDH